MTVYSNLKQTIADLKSSRETLNIYAVQTKDHENESVINDAIKELDGIVSDLEKRMQALEFQEPQYKGY